MTARLSQNSTKSPLLAVEDLRISFGRPGHERQVVKGIGFDINPGETVALVGESGSGKSVTALSILRLLQIPYVNITGRIRLGETDLLSLSEDAMNGIRGNDIAMIFQEPMTSLNPVLKVGHQVAEVLVRHRHLDHAAALAEAARLFERVRIPDPKRRLNDHPHQFSGGMRQRVMIAMALACQPKLLIADEPTTALDVTIQSQILDLIKDLQAEEQMAVLFITHDMGVVAEISDRTVVMYGGEIVETGTTANIFAAPARPYTKALLSAVPELGAMKDGSAPERFAIVSRQTGLVEAEVRPMRPTVDIARPPVLELRGLTTRYDARGPLGGLKGRIHAVENVSLRVRRGETLALVGESGCGKSTLGRSILGIAPVTDGEILVHGKEIGTSGRHVPERGKALQMIFQDPYASLNPRIRVGQAIAEPIITRGLADRREALARAGKLLEQVGLDAGMANRLPHEFSGGQRQRICIARALSTAPDLIVADEAVSALDVSAKAQIVNLMLDLQEEFGLSYLFISHDMAVVERVSHRVAVMYLGRIVEIGSRQAVFNNPQHPYTRRLLAAVPVADPARVRQRHGLHNGEPGNVLRKPDYVPPLYSLDQVGEDHYVERS